MIVGIDARHLAGGRGVAHYTSGLLEALARDHPADEWRAFLPGLGSPAVAPGVTAARHPFPSRALFGAAAVTGRPRLDRLLGDGLDVVWLPAPAPVALSRGVPLVLTVHDLSWVERPADFTPYERLWHRMGRLERLARRADAIVVSAPAVRDVLAERWRVPPERVRVVAPGVPRVASRRDGTGLPERFFLFVGALEPRKAPDLLVRAFAAARARGLDADLVVVGSGRLAGAVRGAGVRLLDAPSAELYERALALVLPSRLEGFGFPPLEAAAAGTPSILSDLPVFAETLGDAAVRVPAGDEEALADALLRVAGEDALRARLGERARERAATFTWERAADGLRAVLAEVAG